MESVGQCVRVWGGTEKCGWAWEEVWKECWGVGVVKGSVGKCVGVLVSVKRGIEKCGAVWKH